MTNQTVKSIAQKQKSNPPVVSKATDDPVAPQPVPTALVTPVTACCGSEQLQSCCQPSAKAACCGAPSTPGSCGCK